MTSNMNTETGIHFGVIPKNDLFNCAEEFFNNAKDTSYEEVIDEITEAINGLSDYVDEETRKEMIEMATTNFSDHYEGDCANMLYEQDGFILQSNNDDPDLFVIKSPYFTMAPGCSPCAPGAGYLRDAIHVGKTGQRLKKDWMSKGPYMTYCLPEDWFEDGKCPYTYWEVSKI